MDLCPVLLPLQSKKFQIESKFISYKKLKENPRAQIFLYFEMPHKSLANMQAGHAILTFFEQMKANTMSTVTIRVSQNALFLVKHSMTGGKRKLE